MSYKFGATSPIAVASITFIVVLLFDVILELMPTVNNIEHLPTMMVGLVLTLLIFKEVKQ